MPVLLLCALLVALVGLAAVLVAFHREEQRTRTERRISVDALTRSRALAESDLALLRTDVNLQNAHLCELAAIDPDFGAPLADRLGELSEHVEILATELHGARSTDEVEAATAAMSRARVALSALAATVADEPVPESLPPCFFNPNHGPSSTVVVWTGADDEPVRVPCCTADAERLRSGAAPYSRTVAADGVRTPWWEAGSTVRPWARGWFLQDPRWPMHDLTRSFPSIFGDAETTGEQAIRRLAM